MNRRRQAESGPAAAFGADARRAVRTMFARLRRAYGPQRWWPARTKTEMVVGAILAQNTAWTNVERAIARLRAARALSWRMLRDMPEAELANLIRPAGTYRVKAKRLKSFVGVLWDHHGGSLRSLLAGDLEAARRRLLAIHGVGCETADAILLYAGGRATFVVDAYTKRILLRHHRLGPRDGYEVIRRLFHAAVPPDPDVYSEYHALLVAVGKRHCRAVARCDGCPLAGLPHDGTLWPWRGHQGIPPGS